MSQPNERAQRLARLSLEKQALMEKWLLERKPTIPSQTIPRRPENGPVPLSFIQEWFWDHPFSEPLAALIEGPLQPALLEQSLNELARRHETLRTIYHQNEQGQPVQVVASEVHISLPVESLEHLPEEEALQEGKRRFQEDTLQVKLDLSHLPVFLVRLLRLSPTRHLILFILPGLITDGRSETLLYRELVAIYESLAANIPVLLPELPVQYADFAVWQHEHFQGAFLEGFLAYWRPRLQQGVHLELPTDYLPNSVGPHDDLPLTTIPPQLVEQLRAIAQTEGATLFMILLAAYQILLLRFTGKRESLIGMEVSSREYPEIEHLIGIFTHLLPLCMLLNPDQSFGAHLRRVRTEALDFYTHRGMHISRILETCYPGQPLLQKRHFTATFAYLPQNALRMEQRSSQFVVQPLGLFSEEDVDELNLQIFDTWHGLQLSIFYHAGLFKESTILRLTNEYLHLLTEIAADPTQSLAVLMSGLA